MRGAFSFGGEAGLNTDWNDLIQRYIAGLTSDEETLRLEAALKADDALADLFLRHIELNLALEVSASSAEVTRELLAAPISTSGLNWPSWRPLTAVVSIALLGLVLWQMWLDNTRTQLRSGRADTVATLLFSEDCEWLDGKSLSDGQPLVNGALNLKRGMAIVRFHGGAEMVLSDETSVVLDSRASVRVNRGRITVRVNEESVGFKVHTPSSELTDLGTEFVLKVSDDGETELHVLDGAVRYTEPGKSMPNDGLQVTTGRAVRFTALGELPPQDIAFDARSFDDILRGATVAPRENKLLVYEPFDYPEAQVPLMRAGRGHGWNGNWQIGPLAKLPVDDPGDMRIAYNRLQGPWRVAGGHRGMLELDGQFGSRMRVLANPVRLDRDGIYYISMMVRWEIPVDSERSSESRFLRLALRSSTHYGGDRVSLTLPGFLRPQVQTMDGFKFTSPAKVRDDEAQLWCAKIIAREYGEDEVSFRIYGEQDSLDFAEPAFWHITSRSTESDAVLDQLVVAAGGVGTAWFDEIRIATSWREVMPPKLMTP